MTADHVHAHNGHTWNELAGSLARRQTKRDDGSPQPEWTMAFHADRQRLWAWLHQVAAHDQHAYPQLHQDRLEAPVPSVKAEPHHFVSTYGETKRGITVELKTCSFNARGFKEPKHTGRQ